MSSKIRVRLAPSPTGKLHVGTARAALFNELFARRHGGTFILRIEDTDAARSRPEFEQDILAGLSWLGLTWDEGPDIGGAHGPYRQSERRALHRRALEGLLANNRAYQKEGEGAVYLKVEPRAVKFRDLIRGEVEFTTDSWGGDFVIARNLDDPLFHLAVVVDDAAQGITHVIRGEDHLSNTARHILLQEALGYTTPVYAHLPLLLDEQRHKLSKRTNETSLLAYRDQGYLPAALRNYLALLGWSPKNNQEFFTHDELISAFALEDVQKGGAMFSVTKLNAVNKYYLRQLSPTQLLERATPFLASPGITPKPAAYWQAALVCEQERVATLAELATAIAFFRPDWPADYNATLLVWRTSDATTTHRLLTQTHEHLAALPDTHFTADALEQDLLAWIDANNLGRGDTLWPLRVALTGQANSPGPFAVAAVLGKAATLKRLDTAIGKIKQ